MNAQTKGGMVDIHCHMLPGLDDGADCLEESFRMAQMAVRDGISTVVVTPHQLGAYTRNSGELIREATRSFQSRLKQAGIPLQVLPGADVRIEKGFVRGVLRGDVMSLADHRKAVLLELPHELYFSLEPILDELRSAGMQGILSHPERNQGILKRRDVVPKLVDHGCLMQVTAGSLVGSMGPVCQAFSEWMLRQGLVHFIATDAHGSKSRRPRLAPARKVVTELTDAATAHELLVENPGRIAAGKAVPEGRRKVVPARRQGKGWFGFGKAS